MKIFTQISFVALAAVLAAASIAAAVPAQATPDNPDSNDSAFIQRLTVFNIPTKSVSHAIQTAQSICGAMRSGYSVQEILSVLDARSSPTVTKDQVRAFYYISMKYYCPEFT